MFPGVFGELIGLNAGCADRRDYDAYYITGAILMKTLVVYYSRTGATRKVAEELARVLHADLEEIRSERSYRGLFGFLRGGHDSMRGTLPVIEPAKNEPGDYDLVILAGPFWAGHAAPPLRAYLDAHKSEIKSVGFVLTLAASDAKQAFAELAAQAGQKPVAEAGILNKLIVHNQFEMAVANFAGPIRAQEEAVF